MQRVIVIGCPGSGKSTFSKALQEATKLPLYHLDRMYWNADGTHVTGCIFRERLHRVLEKESWILDGNYSATMEWRLQCCDTVFFLDYPAELCIDGIKARKGKKRADMPCITREDEDREFMEFVDQYNSVSRPAVMELLQKYSDKQIITFADRSAADNFLSQME